MQVKLKLNERDDPIKYKKVKTLEIVDGFLLIHHKPSREITKTEPINLSIIDFWEINENEE